MPTGPTPSTVFHALFLLTALSTPYACGGEAPEASGASGSGGDSSGGREPSAGRGASLPRAGSGGAVSLGGSSGSSPSSEHGGAGTTGGSPQGGTASGGHPTPNGGTWSPSATGGSAGALAAAGGATPVPSGGSAGSDVASGGSRAGASQGGNAGGNAGNSALAGSGGASATGGGAGSSATGGTTGLPPPAWPLINGVQWADTDGNPIQAHGGGMLKVGEDYYWFGENRNADGSFYAVSAYRSRDLQRWEHVHDVLTMDSAAELKPANIERPKVVYNATTSQYVMWMHWENGRDYGDARAAVASSSTVTGDYTYHGSFRPMQDSDVVDHGKPGYMSRDCTLFVDDDGKAYFLSASNENYDLHLYSLTDDYLSILRREALLFEGGHREAPALFKRGDTYFLLTSGATGWSPNQAKYATSTSLSSGWSSMQNVGDSTTFDSQSTYVLPVESTGGTEYLYMGDRWAGAWSGRVNDSTYVWQPIAFPSETSMSMSGFNTVALDVAAGAVSGADRRFVFVNKNSGRVLAAQSSATDEGADVIQLERDSADRHVWRFDYDGAGYFYLANEDGGQVLDVPDESLDAGVPLHLWDSNGGDHQAWRLLDLGQGEYHVRNKRSGLNLGVAGAFDETSAAIEQQQPGPGDEQIWQIIVAP